MGEIVPGSFFGSCFKGGVGGVFLLLVLITALYVLWGGSNAISTGHCGVLSNGGGLVV